MVFYKKESSEQLITDAVRGGGLTAEEQSAVSPNRRQWGSSEKNTNKFMKKNP